MAKAFFRFLRGELNGFYLQNIHNTMNAYTEDIKQELIDFSKKQFDTENMTTADIYNIGKFAGIYPLWLLTTSFYGIAQFTESHLVNGVERSERGLYKKETEYFEFVHTDEDEYPTDINTLASKTSKTTLVEEDATVRGYIPSSATNVLDSEGNIKPEKIVSTPPEGEAYDNYYGDKYMILEDSRNKLQFPITSNMFYLLFEAMQNIRYNGANIVSLCKIVEALCPDGFVKIKSIKKHPVATCFDVVYKVDYDSDITNKEQRVAILLHILKLKFKQFYLEEEVN